MADFTADVFSNSQFSGMKRLLMTVLAIACFGFANAQQDAVIEKIHNTNEQYKTVSCDFTQVKTMAMVDQKVESAGTLYFNRADKLKMDYNNPKGNLLLISGESLLMIQGNRKNDFNTKQNAQMRNLKNTLLLSIAGDVNGVAKENGAEIAFSETADYYVFVLTKTDKQVKSRMSKLELSYSKKDCSLCVMRMEEPNGNYTIYDTPVKTFNVEIPAGTFDKPKK